MKILAIETSSAACSLALLIDDKLRVVDEIMPMQQAQHILPMLDQLLTSNHITLKELDAIAFGCGPGSFTGIRIAASIAQGLGYAAKLPIISVSSLAALAQATYQEHGWSNLLVAIDARIQEVYWGHYVVNDHGLMTLKRSEFVSKPEEVMLAEAAFAVGNAWEIYQIPYKPIKIDAARLPSASAIAILAKEKYMKNEIVTASQALPVYIRNNVAVKSNKNL